MDLPLVVGLLMTSPRKTIVEEPPPSRLYAVSAPRLCRNSASSRPDSSSTCSFCGCSILSASSLHRLVSSLFASAFSFSIWRSLTFSSSAALEVLTGRVLCELWEFPVTPQQNAVFGQFAENRFIGVNCGIMDQFASAMGRQGHAMLLDTYTLEVEYAPIDQSRISVVIVNSGVKHSLASSAYNTRRRECETALANICERKKIQSLCSLSVGEFAELEGCISDEKCRRRAKHAVSENLRTVMAADALKKGDAEAFGRLMKESHVSLRDDYEVSCEELDFLAETAWEMPFVYGARMTGGGFGGCTVNILQRGSEGEFAAQIKDAYKKKFGTECAVYNIKPGSGAGIIR